MAAPDEEFWVDQGSPFALALTAARAAFERRDLMGMDTQYRRAVQLARGEPAKRAAVAAEHVSRLRLLKDSTRALACCEEYLAEIGENLRLWLMCAETKLTRGDCSRIDADLAMIHRITGGRPARRADDALLHRLEGLAAKGHGQWKLARQHLRQAQELCRALGDTATVSVIDNDLRDLTARVGTTGSKRPARQSADDQSARNPERSPQARLTRSEELRLANRYEDALTELDPALDGSLDPALRFFLLEAKVCLLRLLRQDDQANELMPELYRAAYASARPTENLVAAQRLDSRDGGLWSDDDAVPSQYRLQHVRRLVQKGQLGRAEELLLAEPAPAEPDDRHGAQWQLAAAELTMAIARRDGSSPVAEQAVAHCQECIRHADADSLVPLRITAWRLRGHANAALGRTAEAVNAWAEAHRLEESAVTALQPSEPVRLRMLRGVPDEFDEQVKFAAEQADESDDQRPNALVVAAIEAARGAAILPKILPGREPLLRELPGPSDVTGARRWVRRAVRGMPHSQAVWMLHATQDNVHHVVVTRRALGRLHIRHQSVRCSRHEVIEAIEALATCWKRGGARKLAAMRPGATVFDGLLRAVAQHLGIPGLPELPRYVERIAVVAGGELSDVPFALLPCPGQNDELIGRRYALSDLPCLSVRRPLHRRSRGQRGTSGRRMLVLHGPDDPSAPDYPLTPATKVPGRKPLEEEHATPAELRDELTDGQYRQVRIDCHGYYGDDPARAVLKLAPWGPAGELSPHEFQCMRLDATGTLVLGACETGMAKRIGRDERTGFVRAALSSGASAVLAARWEAKDDVAARILDQFERNLRRYPRDVALFLAQRETDTRDAHPVRWAAWMLYGDTGYQTRRGPLLRWLFRLCNAVTPTPISGPTPGEQQ